MATKTAAPAVPDALPVPGRLPGSAEFAHAATASTQRSAGPFELKIQVQGLPSQLRTGEGGIAIEPVQGHGVRQWLPFASTNPEAATFEVDTRVDHIGDYTCWVATDRAAAAHGYLARAVATVGRTGGSITIDASATLLTFAPAKNVLHAGPFRLSRADDPHWTAPGRAAAGISIRDGAPFVLWLGNGNYELGDPLRAERRLQFSTKGAQSIAISDDLAALRAGRP